jgi:hypothetical protein
MFTRAAVAWWTSVPIILVIRSPEPFAVSRRGNPSVTTILRLRRWESKMDASMVVGFESPLLHAAPS